MKNLIFVSLVVIFSNFCQAQYQWTELTSPTAENLQTAKITRNGDIYVFGNNAFGAKSSNNGQTWVVITGIDSQHRDITACGSDAGQFYLAGKNGLSKHGSSIIGWSDNPIYLEGDIEKMDSDNLGNVYFFPKIIGLGSRYKISTIEMDENQYYISLLYNFYLPLPKINYLASNFKYKSCIAGRDRIITFLHDIDNSGVLTYIFVSDDQGLTWRKINFSFPSMTYIKEVSFKGDIGFIIGCNMSGGGIYLYSSNDNGETWSLVETGSDITDLPKSVYTDFDGVNYRGISVGLKVSGGFVKIDNGAPTILTTSSLNYVTGDSSKIVIVGDNGKVFLGTRISTGVYEPKFSDDDLLIFPNPSNGIFGIKASKIINEIKLFDFSGKFLQSYFSGSQLNILDISNLPAGVYFVQVDGLGKKVIKQ